MSNNRKKQQVGAKILYFRPRDKSLVDNRKNDKSMSYSNNKSSQFFFAKNIADNDMRNDRMAKGRQSANKAVLKSYKIKKS